VSNHKQGVIFCMAVSSLAHDLEGCC
jgi:hypothetical protein